ncbi:MULTISPECIES: hypothetical protein [Yersinia pseudotuberculosis complex]|uniref:Uncharacterized protein n=2 Tax=Yersinia pseudotuberculosis TaxID=633 RepID=A0A380QE75_YERPU|nr:MULTISPECIES: hypothetical protein [Yersinia pseudotuberculosis complex]AJJ59801.1 hypothetical protein BZ22_1214 [Yersinia pseudotuberculosis YPIII]AJJ72849.1 hypothetical protein BZ23_2996 [Yersinia pseudotuberculosis]CFV30550.1 Uncharacterised protein [Yersinia pseudotuberculosis]CNC29459.1 Uncharacterised protein [Yersinia pseudotuberculosis]CNF63283.1 Uncharacterised protein [Yersinia similis]
MINPNIAHLLGISRKTTATKQPTTKKAGSLMKNFSHLFGTRLNASVDIVGTDKQQSKAVSIAKPSQHSREHNVAISDEAKASPVQAIRLLKDTDLSSSKIKKRLAEDPEALTVFTQNFMEQRDPTWELQDDEEKAMTALTYSSGNGDTNGYLAARQRATKALAKMVEPMTEDEIQAMIERNRQRMNAADPNTPDNVEARKQAEEEFNQEMAHATARRNDRLRATGVMLRGDAKRVSGEIVAPHGEVTSIKANLDAGMSPAALTRP